MDGDHFYQGVDVEATLAKLSQDDIINLVMGKHINGIKLEKNERRELKHAIKRDADGDEIGGMLASYIGKGQRTFINLRKKAGQQI